MTNRVKLVPWWREIWKWNSFRTGAAGTILVTFLLEAPDVIARAWDVLPYDLRMALPANLAQWVGIGLLALSLISKFIEQRGLHAKRAGMGRQVGGEDRGRASGIGRAGAGDMERHAEQQEGGGA